MGDTARFACHAARNAIEDAGLDSRALRSPRAGAVIGSGVGTLSTYDAALAIAACARGRQSAALHGAADHEQHRVRERRAGFRYRRHDCYSPSSACTTSALAIGQAMQLIQTGRQDIVLAGGSEALHDNMTLMFDAMGALSRRFNETPQLASRPYDTQRDGFVIASGGGVLVLEALDHALARGARIYAELTGFGHCTDGAGMVAPRAPGIARAMRAALEEAGGAHPDYVNVHAPSTLPGDSEEARAMTEVFGERMPPFSSTKGFTGHPLGACGVHEAIYALLMMRDGFMAGMGDIETPDPCISGLPVVTATRAAHVGRAMSVSFGFGGSCASLVFDAWNPADAGRTF